MALADEWQLSSLLNYVLRPGLLQTQECPRCGEAPTVVLVVDNPPFERQVTVRATARCHGDQVERVLSIGHYRDPAVLANAIVDWLRPQFFGAGYFLADGWAACWEAIAWWAAIAPAVAAGRP